MIITWNIGNNENIFNTDVLGIGGLCPRLGMHIDDDYTISDIKLDNGNLIGAHGDYGGQEAKHGVVMRGVM